MTVTLIYICDSIMTMKKLHVLAILMMVVLVAITGFQVYWIRDNYVREQQAVETKAQVLFRETIRDVQDSIIQSKLYFVLSDSGVTGFKRTAIDSNRRSGPVSPRAARVLHLLGNQIDTGSAKKRKAVRITLTDEPGKRRKQPYWVDSTGPATIDKVVVMGTNDRREIQERQKSDTHQFTMSRTMSRDSGKVNFTEFSSVYLGTNKGEGVKISFDSLFVNDVATVEVLQKAFSKRISDQGLDIPFSILKSNQPAPAKETKDFVRRPAMMEYFEGYQLQLGNAFSYVIKRISGPIVFSVLLVGLAIFSFVLLYRSLLRQHRLAEMKSDLISNITHELKTPIATVGVAIEALKNFNAMQDPARTREYLDISQNEIQRLGLLVDKVLKLSMFESKEITLKNELFDFGDVVAEVVGSLKLQAERNQADIKINRSGNLSIEGDRLHILSVVFNLIDNALKYNNGNVLILVDLKEEPDHIFLKVTDNGIGIPGQYKDKVFEKFFRVPAGNTHNAKGHGLGLSYVAQVVKQHGGRIKVESEEGGGSSFIVQLPKPN